MTAGSHARLGWWMLALFAGGGLVLESLIGLRTPWLLDVGMETRRVMFRLAHAHGALFGLVHVAFATSWHAGLLAAVEPDGLRGPSRLLTFGSVCVPLGFALGGSWFVEADPGLGVLLVPIGALAVVAALISIARACARA
jgi:hypothetical protein